MKKNSIKHLSLVSKKVLLFFCLGIVFYIPQFQAQTNNTCCALSCSDGLSPLLYCDKYNNNPGPFYVKLYLRFVNPTDGLVHFDQSFEDRANLIWAKLANAFHGNTNIFFVPGFGGCEGAGSFQVISSNVLPDINLGLSEFNDLRNGSTNGVDNFKEDGINLYIFRDDVIFNSDALCVPNNYCYVSGHNGEIIMSKTLTTAHEVAHCLGLLHTFDGECIAIANEPCNTVGDLVCETPPESQLQYFNFMGCTGINPPFDFENIMSYYNFGRCAKHFKEEQGARMRYYLKNEYGVLNKVVQKDIVINAGINNWNTPMNVPANVYIEPGAVLNINAPVTMQEHAYIYIKANHTPSSSTYGGRLVVSNLVTAACPGKLWQGIIVDGDENQLQSTQKQAKLSLKSGGIIEHALIGSRVKGQNLVTGEILDYATGGIVTSGLGIFRNNVQDIFFAAYSEVNSSTIIRTSFITNDNYRGGATAPTHITMDRVENIRFIECKFNDLRMDDYTSSNSRGIGIDAKGSKFSITGASEFTNLFHGIHITNLSAYLGNSIRGATFNHCFTGINSAYNANFLSNDNTFNIVRPNNFKNNVPQELIGIYMEGLTEAFSVSGNNFLGDAKASFNDQAFGTDVMCVTTSNNTITKNLFQNLYIGNRANGSNAIDNGTIYSGLQYTCNRFYINYLIDNNVKPNGAIRKVQGGFSSDGIQKFSAGNIFNENTPLLAEEFTNEGKDFNYHHIPFSSQELSQGFYTPATIKPFSSSTNPDCDSGGEIGCNNPPCAEPFIAQTKSQFYQTKQQWQSKLAAFSSITNASQRETAANSINSLRYELDTKGKTILLHYALDTNEIKIDSILHWLDLLDNYDADLQLAQYHFFKGNFAISDPLLLSIPILYGLDNVMLTEFNSIVSVLQMMRTSIQAGVAVKALPSSVVDALQSGWGTACNSAGALTRAVLYLNGRNSVANCDGVQGRDLPAVSSNNFDDLKVFPNPANSSVTIEKPENNQSLDIRIINLSTGHNDIHATMALTQKSIILDTSNLVSGVYAVFVDNSLIINTFKLVIQH
jgi:hypothetical protein